MTKMLVLVLAGGEGSGRRRGEGGRRGGRCDARCQEGEGEKTAQSHKNRTQLKSCSSQRVQDEAAAQLILRACRSTCPASGRSPPEKQHPCVHGILVNTLLILTTWFSTVQARSPRMAEPIVFSGAEKQRCEDLRRPWNQTVEKKSNQTLIIGLGLPKTGSSSTSAVLNATFPGAACHNSLDKYERFPDDMTHFVMSPLDGATPLSRQLHRCREVSNAWSLAFPAVYTRLMATYPNSKFILTRWRSCEKWLHHYSGLWEIGIMARQWVNHDTHRSASCAFGSMFINNATRRMYVQRCEQHEVSVQQAARAHNRPLLVLDMEEPDATKLSAIEAFVGMPHMLQQYPRICSPSTHNVCNRPNKSLIDTNSAA